MPPPRKPRIRARLAGPSGLAAALALGAAGPASASVHRAAIAGPGPGWAPAAATPTDSPLGALAVLGACGLAGFILLLLGRRKDIDEPEAIAPHRPDLEAMMRSTRSGPGSGPDRDGQRAGDPAVASATATDGAPAPIWVKRLNEQAPPPPEPTRLMDGAYRG
jgi:hypothetical protein